MSQSYWQPFKKLKLNNKRPISVYIIITICIIAFFADQMTAYMITGDFGIGLLSIYGMKNNGLIINGEWWRFVTSIFLHGDVTHVGFNMMALFIWGKYVEALYGSIKYALIFMLAGFMGSIFSFAFTQAPSLGASGAIYGLFGALLYFRKYDKKLFNFIIGATSLVYMAVSLFSGFANSYIDNMAHIGGLIGGYLAARMIGLISEKNTERKVLPWIGVYGAVLALCLVIGYA